MMCVSGQRATRSALGELVGRQTSQRVGLSCPSTHPADPEAGVFVCPTAPACAAPSCRLGVLVCFRLLSERPAARALSVEAPAVALRFNVQIMYRCLCCRLLIHALITHGTMIERLPAASSLAWHTAFSGLGHENSLTSSSSASHPSHRSPSLPLPSRPIRSASSPHRSQYRTTPPFLASSSFFNWAK